MKRIILYAIAFVITATICNAQNFADFRFKSMMQGIAEEAIKPGLFVIRQDYVIKRNSDGATFGLDNRPEFGTTYSLAVKTTNGYIISEPAVKPWLYDKHYDQLQDKKSYTPVILQTRISPLQDSLSYSQIDISDSAKFENHQRLWIVRQPDTSNGSFPTFQTGYSGYTVWISVDEKKELHRKMSAKFSFTTDSIAFDKPTVITPNFSKDNILGGLYIIPSYPKIGEIQFQLAAVIVPEQDGWAAVPLQRVKRATPLNLTPTENTPHQSGNEKDKKKNKKK